MKELSKILDQLLTEYDLWLVKEKKDSPLIPFERAACKTFLLWAYQRSDDIHT